jgi:hypothetical protein
MLTSRLAVPITALGLAVAAGLPGAAFAQDGDNAYGNFDTSLGTNVSFNVEADVDGSHPTGQLQEEGPFGPWEGVARCLNVTGDRATLGFAGPRGSGLLLWIHDIASSGTIYAKRIGASQPVSCPDPRQGPDPALDPIGVGGSTYVSDHLPPPPPGGDAVTGGAYRCLIQYPGQSWCDLSASLSVQAGSGPSGQRPGGVITVYQSGQTPGAGALATGAVTCLSVHGQTAIIGVTGGRERFGVSQSVYPFTGLVRVADTVQFAVKVGSKNGLPFQGPTDCSSFPGAFPTGDFQFPDFANESGEVTVADRAPPTAYAQCRNSGWQSFGAYSSQADCLASVQDRARQACIFERAAHGVEAFRLKYGRPADHANAMQRCVRLHTG